MKRDLLDDKLRELLADAGDDDVAALDALALALPAEAPPPSLRARVLADAKPPRLHAMIDKLASLFDVARGKARALLETLDDPAAWQPGPVDNSWIMLLDAKTLGAKVADAALIGFVKMGPSVRWPVHKHHGTEYMLVLEGGFKQDDGVEVHPGQLHVMQKDSVHGFTIFDDETCISAAVVFGGVEFEDPSAAIGGLFKE